MDPNLQTILGFAGVGFLAQLVDGCLGMAYGVLSNTLMLALGKPPALASASLKVAETFTTAVSGVSHWKFGNVDWKLVGKLAIPGVLGGVLGAYILTNLDGNMLKPFIALYLIAMGFRVLWKAFKHDGKKHHTYVAPLGLVGGFFDAIGGGGWGPTATTRASPSAQSISPSSLSPLPKPSRSSVPCCSPAKSWWTGVSAWDCCWAA